MASIRPTTTKEDGTLGQSPVHCPYRLDRIRSRQLSDTKQFASETEQASGGYGFRYPVMPYTSRPVLSFQRREGHYLHE